MTDREAVRAASPIDEVIAEATGFTPRRIGRELWVLCPFHDDHTPSLRISVAKQTYYCDPCDCGGDVFDFVMRFNQCDFKTALRFLARRARLDVEPPDVPAERRLVATYNYFDREGALVAQKRRYEPGRRGRKKDFYWRRPDGAGGWLNKLNGVPAPLFQLPALLASDPDAFVFIVAGEKDVLRAGAEGLVATTSPDGENLWNRSLNADLAHRHVALIPDNDDKGLRFMENAARSLLDSGDVASLRVLPPLPGVPKKGDLSDFFDNGSTVDELLALVRAAPDRLLQRAASGANGKGANGPTPVAAASSVDGIEDGPHRRTTVQTAPRLDLADIERLFSDWLYGDDRVPTRAMLAAYVANRRLDGDPVWMMLVGGSGIGKTERLAPLSAMPDVVLASSITGPAGLLSGTSKKERAADATGGLLRRIPGGGGVLVLKDFTSILEMHRDARAEVLAAFREIYDGRWDRSVGADGGRTLTWEGRLGLIAGCTTAIDSAHAVMAAMGARFVLVRVDGIEQEPLARAALAQAGRERRCRDELHARLRAFLERLPGSAFVIDAQTTERLTALSSYVALARSPVDRDHRGEIRLVLDAEAPTRLAKMLGQLWRAGGLLGLSPAEAWAMVRRVGMDSIPKLRRAILDYLGEKSTDQVETSAIAEAVEHPTTTTRRALEDLAAHRVVVRTVTGQGKPDLWRLSDRARQRRERFTTVPVLSDTTHDSDVPSNEPFPPNDDITEKVGNADEGLF